MSNKTLVIGLITLLFLLVSYEYTIAGGPWKGQIMDIETKEPIEGAVVLAVWERVYRTPAGASSYFYEAKEVLTDKEGKFEIKSYTPINVIPLISYMRGPRFTIFKPGYGSLTMVLDKYLAGVGADVYEMELSGKKYRLSTGLIELPKLKTREERVRGGLHDIPAEIGGEVPESKIKKLMKAINEERLYLGLQLFKVEEE